MRLRLSFLLIVGALFVTLVAAQQSDEVRQKPVEIRKADAVESPTPGETPAPRKKKKPSPSPTPKRKTHPTVSQDTEPDETPVKKTAAKKQNKDESDEPSPAPSAKKKGAGKSKKASPTVTPSSKKKKTPAQAKAPEKSPSPSRPPETPTPTPSAARNRVQAAPTASPARAQAVPTPSAPPAPSAAINAATSPAEEPEQLTIEKSGYERPRGFWARFFGGGGRQTSSGAGYRYLTASVRAAIDRAGADHRNPRWQMIVVHNSGTRQGNARVFDYYHRHVRHMQNGLAYHFVIGNGTSTRNGEVEVGDRWRRQINGGHVHSDYLNNIALGICLVGDFNRDQPTRAQLDCCEELIRYLRQRCGKYDNFHFPVVKPHREANPPRWGTDCPGNVFPYSWFRRFRE